MKTEELENQLSRVVVLSDQLKESARSLCDLLLLVPTGDIPPGVQCDFSDWIKGLSELRNALINLQDPEAWGIQEQA